MSGERVAEPVSWKVTINCGGYQIDDVDCLLCFVEDMSPIVDLLVNFLCHFGGEFEAAGLLLEDGDRVFVLI